MIFCNCSPERLQEFEGKQEIRLRKLWDEIYSISWHFCARRARPHSIARLAHQTQAHGIPTTAHKHTKKNKTNKMASTRKRKQVNYAEETDSDNEDMDDMEVKSGKKKKQKRNLLLNFLLQIKILLVLIIQGRHFTLQSVSLLRTHSMLQRTWDVCPLSM